MMVETNIATMPKGVDEIFAEWDKPDSPGCALGIVRGDTLIHARGYGMASLDFDIPITPSTVFHIASTSKQFTAMAILLLAQDGKVSLDEGIHTYIPEIPDFGHTITLRHLIYHTSGLRDQFELLSYAGWREHDVMSTADALDLVTRQRALNFSPGETYLYSNTGYTLMGVVVERVSGTSLRVFCEERIFAPLRMTSTHFHDDRTEIVKQRATAYVPNEGGGFTISVPAYDTVGATSLFTTVEDLARWVGNLRNGVIGGKNLIAQATAPGRLNSGLELKYAFGFELGEHRGLRVVEHEGSDHGYRANLLWLPDEDVAVIALCNLGVMPPDALCRQVVDVFLADRVAASDTEREVSVSLNEEQLRRHVGIYHRVQRPDHFRATGYPGAVRRVEVRNDHLVCTYPSGRAIALASLAPDRFRETAGYPVEVRFEETGSGRQMIETRDGAATVFLAVAPFEVDIEGLAEYAGAYYSEELDVTYRIVREGDGLVLHRRKFPDYALEPALRDVFRYRDSSTLTFDRDAEGAITGFRLSDPRDWNMWFARVAAGHRGPPES